MVLQHVRPHLLPILLLLLLQVSLSHGATSHTLYVATWGSDAQQGTEAEPLATLEGARNAIRQRRRAEGAPRGPVEVLVRQGMYTTLPFGKPLLQLTAMDSGTDAAPITYRAFPGEDVVLSGGMQVCFLGEVWTNEGHCPEWRRKRGVWHDAWLPNVLAGVWRVNQQVPVLHCDVLPWPQGPLIPGPTSPILRCVRKGIWRAILLSINGMVSIYSGFGPLASV